MTTQRAFTILTALTLSVSGALGQDTTSIAKQSKSKVGYKQWTNFQTSLRFGVGLQKSFYSELGISRLKYIYNDLGYAATAYYGAIEWTPLFSSKERKNIYGLKIGWETNLRALALGIESKYQTDGNDKDFVLTPKIGLGIFGALNIFYGYNISFAGSPFPDIGHNQFSIVCNLNKTILRIDNK